MSKRLPHDIGKVQNLPVFSQKPMRANAKGHHQMEQLNEVVTGSSRKHLKTSVFTLPTMRLERAPVCSAAAPMTFWRI